MSMMKNGVESFKGQVVEAGTHEFRMSDYSQFSPYGVILKADGSYETVFGEQAVVDATPDQIQAYKDKVAVDDAARVAKAEAHAAELEAKTIRKGKRVKVVRGRKVALGTEGIVFWMKEQVFSPRFKNGYKHGPDAVKIGIALDDVKDARGRHMNVAWTYEANVEVVA